MKSGLSFIGLIMSLTALADPFSVTLWRGDRINQIFGTNGIMRGIDGTGYRICFENEACDGGAHGYFDKEKAQAVVGTCGRARKSFQKTPLRGIRGFDILCTRSPDKGSGH